MNTNETKAKLWNTCVEKGIFNKVKGEDFKKIQEIFEKIVKGYETLEPSQEVFSKIIDSVSLEIQNQNQTQSISYENIQKEYDQLLNAPVPKQIDFTTIPSIQSISSLQSVSNTNLEKNQIRLEEIIMTQNKILIQILESQVKIIEALKK
jgi:hypothetical protein